MKTNTISQIPYLRTSRNFPEEAQPLAVEINKSYVDIANFVNARTIGIFAENQPIINGETWFFDGSQRRQGVRELFTLIPGSSIIHGIDLDNVFAFTKIYGTFTDGINWYPLPFTSSVDATNQISVVVTPTLIIVTTGAGSPPTIVSGIIVLEYVTNL